MAEDLERSLRQIWGLVVRVVVLIAGVYLLIRFGPHVIHRIESILVAVLAAVVLTYILLPSVEGLCRKQSRYFGRRCQRLVATLLVFIAFLGLVSLSVFLFVTPFQKEIQQFSSNVVVYTEQLGDLFKSASHWYRTQVPVQVRDLIGKLDYGKLLAGVTESAQQMLKLATSSVGFVLELVLIPVLAFYFVLDYKSISRDVYGLVPSHRRKEAVRIGRGIGEILQSYIFGQLILCAIAGVVTGIVLALMDLPYVVVLAIFAGVTRAIPVIGPVVSGIPIVLVGLLSPSGGLATAIWLTVFVTAMHFAESKFIMPKLIGYRLHLHPAVVIIALLVGAQFLGIVGMFLAAPVAAVVRELVRFYYIKPGGKPRKLSMEEEQAEPPLIETRSA